MSVPGIVDELLADQDLAARISTALDAAARDSTVALDQITLELTKRVAGPRPTDYRHVLERTVQQEDPLAEFPDSAFLLYYLLTTTVPRDDPSANGRVLRHFQNWSANDVVDTFVGLRRLAAAPARTRAAIHMTMQAIGLRDSIAAQSYKHPLLLALTNRPVPPALPVLSMTEAVCIVLQLVDNQETGLFEAVNGCAVLTAIDSPAAWYDEAATAALGQVILKTDPPLGRDLGPTMAPMPDGRMLPAITPYQIAQADRLPTEDVVHDAVEFGPALARTVCTLCRLDPAAVRPAIAFDSDDKPVVALLLDNPPYVASWYANAGLSHPPRWGDDGSKQLQCELLLCTVTRADVHLNYFFFRATNRALNAEFMEACDVARPLIASLMLEALKWVSFTVIRAEHVSLQDAWSGYDKASNTRIGSNVLQKVARLTLADSKSLTGADARVRERQLSDEQLSLVDSTPQSRTRLVVDNGYYGRVGFLSLSTMIRHAATGDHYNPGSDSYTFPVGMTHVVAHPARAMILIGNASGEVEEIVVWVPWDEPQHLLYRRLAAAVYTKLKDAVLRERLFGPRVPARFTFSLMAGASSVTLSPDRPAAEDPVLRLYDFEKILPKQTVFVSAYPVAVTQPPSPSPPRRLSFSSPVFFSIGQVRARSESTSPAVRTPPGSRVRASDADYQFQPLPSPRSTLGGGAPPAMASLDEEALSPDIAEVTDALALVYSSEAERAFFRALVRRYLPESALGAHTTGSLTVDVAGVDTGGVSWEITVTPGERTGYEIAYTSEGLEESQRGMSTTVHGSISGVAAITFSYDFYSLAIDVTRSGA